MDPPRDNPEVDQRLSRIATRWSMVLEAHGESAESAVSARQRLVEQYTGAVFRYLRGAVRDADVAEDLSGEFALRLLQGSFRNVRPGQGRFRDYVKKVLINLANEHYRSQKRRPGLVRSGTPDAVAVPELPGDGPSFEDCLREELLERAWKRLEQTQPRYYEVLRARVDNPELSSTVIAETLSERSGKRLTSDTVRKTLERSRAKLAELLLDEVARAAGTTGPDDLRDELKQLDLLKYCRSALERRTGA